MTAAGKLDQRITIRPQPFGQDAFGANVKAMPTMPETQPFDVWAYVRQQSAGEKQRNGITVTESTYVIRIRHREGVTASAAVEYRGRTLQITSVVEGGQGNREWLEIAAVEAK